MTTVVRSRTRRGGGPVGRIVGEPGLVAASCGRAQGDVRAGLAGGGGDETGAHQDAEDVASDAEGEQQVDGAE
jgi:hypothetical protein